MKIFYRVFLLGIFLSLSGVSNAQIKPLIDSLEKKIRNASTSQEKIIALNDLGYELIDYDNKRAYDFASQALALAQSTNNHKGQTIAINSLAIIAKDKGNYSLALEELKNALAIAESENDSSEIARSYYNIGDVFKSLNSHDRAIGYFMQAYKMYTALHQKTFAMVSLNKVAHGYMDKGSALEDTIYYKKALVYYKKALELSEAMNNKNRISVAYINLANAYNSLGKKVNSKEYLFTSLDCSMRGLKLSREGADKIREAINLDNIGEVYQSLGSQTKALPFFKQALKLFQESEDNYWIVYEYSTIAKTYNELKDFPQAVDYLVRSNEGAKEQNLKDILRDNYSLLASIYVEQKNYEKALEAKELSGNYKDSVSNENSNLTVARLQTELESDKKDKEIQLLNKDKEIQNQKISNESIFRNFLIIGIIFLTVLLLMLYNRYRIKQKTELQIIKAKETAEQAKELQEQFLANTSHEIRTPMNGIIGMTNHLKESELSDEQLEYISAINESANNLLVIINDLLDLSKINAGKMTFDKRPFHVSDVFKSLIYSLQYRSAEKNIRLISSIDEKVPGTIIGDPIRLSQILLNLAGNAIKFTERGEVKIIAKLLKDDGKDVLILFDVTDTGIGIPENKLTTIFESFTQVNAKTTRKYGGTGLGLAIVKKLVEQQGGAISVSSKVNEGSSFSFSLTFRKQTRIAKETKEVHPTIELARPNLNQLKILVVDDNKVNQRVAALTLQKWNAIVEPADSAKIAFEKLKEGKFDLILMDVTMPIMDGIEATQYIRNSMSAPVNAIPIIAMTASALIGDREKCISVGMNEYVSKPFNPEDLYDKIIKCVPLRNSVANTTIVDLSILRGRAEGDVEYLKEIMETYIQEMPVYVEEMKKFMINKDVKSIVAQAHKMKSPAKLLGAFELDTMLVWIEGNPAEAQFSDALEEKVTQMNLHCLQTVESLKKELAQIV